MSSIRRWYQQSFVFTVGGMSETANSAWTVIFFAALGFLAFLLQIFSITSACFTPAEFTTAYVRYTNQYCWYANKIKTLDFQKQDDFMFYDIKAYVTSSSDDVDYERTFYQWVPLILIFQAFLFKLPNIIWQTGISTFGINVYKLLSLADDHGQMTRQERLLAGKQIARYLTKYIEASTIKGLPWGIITLVYIVTKCLYLINVVTQYAVVNKFLLGKWQNSTDNFGYYLSHELTNSNASEIFESSSFPSKVICKLNVHFLQNTHRYAMQCDLPINHWYYRIYSLVWVWLVFVLILTTVSCFIDTLKFIIPVFRKRFMASYLSMIEDLHQPPNDSSIASFASTMGQDIVIILKFLEESSNVLIVGDTVSSLWDIHIGRASQSYPVAMYTAQQQQPAHAHRTVNPSAPQYSAMQTPHAAPYPETRLGAAENVPLMPVGNNEDPYRAHYKNN